MAFPTSITQGDVAPQNSYHGPFLSSAGNVYVVLDTSNEDGVAVKATDPATSFAEQDSGNRPDLGAAVAGNTLSTWVHQKGDKLHAVSVGTDGGTRVLAYYRFDMGSDTWDAIDGGSDRDIIIGTTTIDDGPGASACTIVAESTGNDLVVVAQGNPDKIMGTSYARVDAYRSSSANIGQIWGGAISIDNGGEVDWTGPVAMLGTSDRVHIHLRHHTGNDAYYITLRADDSLSTLSVLDLTSTTATPYMFGKGIGGATIYGPYIDSNGKASLISYTSADSPSASLTADISDNTVEPLRSTCLGLADDAGNQHLLYVDDTDLDLYRDSNTGSGWGTDIEVRDAVSLEHVSPNIYNRSGTKLAFVYDDAGTVKYDEVSLAAATPSLVFRRPTINNQLVR